jgi:hypothetical protein
MGRNRPSAVAALIPSHPWTKFLQRSRGRFGGGGGPGGGLGFGGRPNGSLIFWAVIARRFAVLLVPFFTA